MSTTVPGCYAGKILRVDLTNNHIWTQPWTPELCRTSLGGVGLGAKILWEEVPPEVPWDHPENRLVMATGPLAGLPAWGTGGLTVVTRGALTNGATNTQANGFFGANLKYSGYDAIVLQGRAPSWVYLYIRDDTVELRDASTLLGKDTWETQQALEQTLNLTGHQLSVYTSGIAGENQVRFAAIHGDYGHVASKNGCGAVMGNKRLKAVAIVRGSKSLSVADPRGLWLAADEIAHDLRFDPSTQSLYEYGTLPGVVGLSRLGALPIKNYTTNVVPEGVDMNTWTASSLRNGFDHRGHQCNACGMHHCHAQVLSSGPHQGEIVDEPEYEGWSGAGWATGCTNPVDVSWLNTQIDRACVDVNEFGWLIGWVMECQEKGYITTEQLGGLEVKWGDAEAANTLLQMTIRREGFGNILAEGVKRASEIVGGAAAECAIYTMKGDTPRGHDHRARWEEMLDTCTGSGGTIDSGPPVQQTELGQPPRINPFDPEAVAKMVGGTRGRRHFEDSLGTCIFTTRTTLAMLCRVLSAATGWEFSKDDAVTFGRRTAALMRAFNVRCGITPDLERPSKRYGSVPVDGPAKGQDVGQNWERMVRVWYDTVGYDPETGKPFPATLEALGLTELIPALWG